LSAFFVMKLLTEVKKYIREAQKRMRLEHWEINLSIEEESENGWLMSVSVNPDYLQAGITVYEKNIKKEINLFGILELKKAVYHEISHILTYKLKELATKRYATEDEIQSEYEKLAEHISRIILNSPNLIEKNKSIN